MQDLLLERIKALGTAEKDIVTKNHLIQLETWARLLDEVGANLHVLAGFGNSEAQYNQARQQFEQSVLNYLNTLDLANDPNSYQNLKSQIANFEQYFPQLVDMKTKILTINNDLTDLEAIKRANSEARKRKDELEKSFSEYTQKQAEESTRTLAKYFEARLKDLKRKDNTLTSPEFWAKRRTQWLGALIGAVFVLAILYFVMIQNKLFQGYEWQILILKAAVVAIFYLQYHFATKNYHIYADLVAKYEHRSVISKTMTDFSAAAYEDEILREAVLSNASKTLFSDIDSGHQKSTDKDGSVFENIINQIPRNGQ
jgi:hypothetical protein